MRVAVSNDDGADAPGLAALVAAVAHRGWDCHAVADRDGLSGCGTALRAAGRTPRISHHDRGLTVLDESTPALAALLAVTSPTTPALFIAGVNHGPNVGPMAMHSGTVGAAIAAWGAGVAAVAVSCDDVHSTMGKEDGDMHFATAAAVGVAVAASMTAVETASPKAVSVNVPNRPLAELAGLRTAVPQGPVPAVAIGCDGQLEIVHGTATDPAADGETTLLRQGFAVVTVIAGTGTPAWLAAVVSGAGTITIEGPRAG